MGSGQSKGSLKSVNVPWSALSRLVATLQVRWVLQPPKPPISLGHIRISQILKILTHNNGRMGVRFQVSWCRGEKGKEHRIQCCSPTASPNSLDMLPGFRAPVTL